MIANPGADAQAARVAHRSALAGEDARVRDHDIEAAESLAPGRQRGGHVGADSHVADRRDDLAAQALDLVHGLVELGSRAEGVVHGADLRAQIHRDDVRAFTGQPQRVAAALTTRRAGDKRNLVLKPTHLGLLC